jgi:thiol-disulfide isomerase/thioredoxin
MKSGKRIGYFMLAVIVLLVALFYYKKYRVAPSIPLLTQELIDEQNIKTSLEQYKGKPMIISYYASWCGDCRKELKELNEVIDADLKNVRVICITDEEQQKLISFTAAHNYPFQFYRLTKRFSDINIHSIPVTYLVNSKGEVVYNKVGAVKWKDKSFMEFAKKQLE